MNKLKIKFKTKSTANIGEWSELYVLIYILVYGGMFGADKYKEKNISLFYKVLKVFSVDGDSSEVYEIEAGGNVYLITDLNKKILINKKKLKEVLTFLHLDLLDFKRGRTFTLKSGQEALTLLHKHKFKAANTQKKDIELMLIDFNTNSPTPRIGFSIKSQLGGSSSLTNASSATNFIFEVLDKQGKTPKIQPVLQPKKIKDNIQQLLENGYTLVFRKLESEIFSNNLTLIDSNMTQFLSKILLSYYSREASKLKDLLNHNYFENSVVENKIGEFLSVMALGMTPNTYWDGTLTSLGGMLLVKRDGDVLCYYLYNLKDFRKFLIDNTKLETPSTSRHKFGQIINKEGRMFIKLNLQIRFIK